MTVSSCVTSVVPPHTPATPLTPMMTTCPPAMSQAVRPESQTITVTLPITPLVSADGMADQRRHWWHIEEARNLLYMIFPPHYVLNTAYWHLTLMLNITSLTHFCQKITNENLMPLINI